MAGEDGEQGRVRGGADTNARAGHEIRSLPQVADWLLLGVAVGGDHPQARVLRYLSTQPYAGRAERGGCSTTRVGVGLAERLVGGAGTLSSASLATWCFAW